MLNRSLFLVSLLVSTGALASEESDQAMLLAPPASRAALPDSGPAPAGGFWSLGLGTGVNSFGGNAGQLYSKSAPVAELRGTWALNGLFAARVGGDLASYSFNAAPNGAVELKTQGLQAAAELHYLGSATAADGFDPYVNAGAGLVERTQTFQDHNDVEKDSAYAALAGLGTNYRIARTHMALWLEADASEIFFPDRYSQEYVPSGVADLTGLLYSARLGVKYVF